MALRLQTLPIASFNFTVDSKLTFLKNVGSLTVNKSKRADRGTLRICSALPETAASIVVAAAVVGTAATFLVKRNKSSQETQVPMKTCEECGGSGICPECKGEGFVLKRLSDERAERARLTATNAATRYTAGLPKKWSYCTKCSSTRSCITCGGSGKLSYLN